LRVYIRSNHAALQSHSNPILELGGVQRGDASAPLGSAVESRCQRAALAAGASRGLHVRRAANFHFDVCARRQLSKVWRSNQRGVSSFCRRRSPT